MEEFMNKSNKYFLTLVKKILIYICVFTILIIPLNAFAVNPIKIIKPPPQAMKYLPKLTNYGIKSINKADLALASKSDNIATMLEYQRNTGKLTDAQVYRYYKEFNSLEKGDELLLMCFQRDNCNLQNYTVILSDVSKVATKIDKGTNVLFSQKTIAGTINWENTIQKGHFGEHYTYSMMARDGRYVSRKLKIGAQGIDHVYIKQNPVTKEIDEILIIETKTDNAPLIPKNIEKGIPKQMSDEWIKKNLDIIIVKGDNQSKQLAKIIKDKLDTEPQKVKKMIYRHKLEEGKTIKIPVDKNGNEFRESVVESDEYYPMKNKLTAFAKSKGILVQ